MDEAQQFRHYTYASYYKCNRLIVWMSSLRQATIILYLALSNKASSVVNLELKVKISVFVRNKDCSSLKIRYLYF